MWESEFGESELCLKLNWVIRLKSLTEDSKLSKFRLISEFVTISTMQYSVSLYHGGLIHVDQQDKAKSVNMKAKWVIYNMA